MSKIKEIFSNWKVWVVIACIILAIFAINPNFNKGVAIRNVIKDSPASLAGIENPKATIAPTQRERVIEINSQIINNFDDYNLILKDLKPNIPVIVKTNKDTYKLTLGNSTDLGLRVYDAPTNNLKKGLDLQGGTRVLLKPETELSKDDMDIVLSNMKERLNVYGLSDIIVRDATDLTGNQYILVEIAGANEEEVKQLISQQGKFESKISNVTVFKGGGDITYVCRTADCSGIDPYSGCSQSEGIWYCRFRFAISLTPEAAQRQADASSNLAIITKNGENYLNQTIDLFLDDVLVDSLNIGAELKGKASTDIQISGSGSGLTQQEAIYDSLANMKRLQTILITGSLPVKLNIVKTDLLSPVMGEQFLKNSLIMGLFATLAVIIILIISYKNIKIALPIMVTCLLEIFLTLGIAALIGWNLDMAAIAGLIITVGTGVNDQIVITDEAIKGEKKEIILNWKQRLKNAFFIIFSAYATMLAAMVPLYFAGAGLLRGFAVTTIIGMSIGVFVTRPAYAEVIEILLKK